MDSRTRLSHLWVSLCVAVFLSLLLVPYGRMYQTVLFILLLIMAPNQQPPSQSIVSDLLAKIDSLRQGERTVEEYLEEFVELWKELETLRPLPVCTCGAKCFCSDALRREKDERKKLKMVSLFKGLDKDYDSVVKEIAAQMVSGDEKSQPPSTLKQATPKTKPEKERKKDEKLMNHAIHPHPLTWKPSGAPFMCSGCRELGLGPSYCCDDTDNCDYVLHEDCANAKTLDFHPFFEKSNFEFYKKKPDAWKQKFCGACGNDVLGFFYHCDTTEKDLHPCCFKLKDSISDSGGLVTLKLCNTVPKRCQKCKDKKVDHNIKGWSYVSSDGDYCFHVSCVKGLILDRWKEGYFSKENMSLQSYDPETQIPLTSKEIVKAGGRSKGSGSKTKAFVKIASLALRLIVAVVFGHPGPLLCTAVEAISDVIVM